MAIELLSLTTELDSYGGAQKVLMDLHESLKLSYNAKVLGLEKFENLHPKYNIQASEYKRLTNPFYLNNKILIVHSRNVMAFIILLKYAFFLNTKILYVSHNVYYTLNWASFFPKDIISISEKVTENLINYFHLKKRNINLIYNGIKDEGAHNPVPSPAPLNDIIILYPARLNAVKRQLEIIDKLSGKLLTQIKIHFAGTGPDYDELVIKCKDSQNFKALGFIDNMQNVIINSDYLMLYSIQEGLPIALIEGTMYGKPILINDVGGNTEIGVPGFNGILLSDDWSNLAQTLNDLTSITAEKYSAMSVNSRKRYEEMFTYDTMVANYMAVIKLME